MKGRSTGDQKVKWGVQDYGTQLTKHKAGWKCAIHNDNSSDEEEMETAALWKGLGLRILKKNG